MVERKASARELRRVLGAAAPTIQKLAHNDQVSQSKITALEAKAAAQDAFIGMTFRQRVTWLFRGMQ